ncbi:MAG: BamA/TamA family outer membrane protein, partial [Gemmatimonadales bacterium]|nr:BamA/TamA family outer membrane protein [Gemmatimonadales bacterium]
MRPGLRWGIAVALLAALAGPAGAQDPPIVIDPDAPVPDSLLLAAPPPEVVEHLLTVHNDSATTRLLGTFVLPAGTRLSGTLSLFRGMLVVGGEVSGPVHVINGDLWVSATGRITGDVIVTGGRIRIDPGGVISGTQRTWSDPAPVYRNTAGRLALRERARTVGELASTSRSFYTAGISTTVYLGTGGSYNRIEGLPIVVGPSFAHEVTPTVDLRMDLRGIVRTTTDPTGIRDRYGYDGRLELVFGVPARAVLGGRLRSEVVPIEEAPWSRTEAGWLAFLMHEDTRDYYQARGPEVYVEAEPRSGITVTASLREDIERSVRATDPISLFRSSEAWRPNPLIDDGTYRTLRLGLGVDSRNDRVDPTSGWLVKADWEYGVSTDYAPVSLPRSIREPLPEDREYHFGRLWVDARRYARFDPDTRLNLRVVGGGWVGGDPLPLQRRVSLGGGDLLPGYGFRARDCSPDRYADPAGPALCDRALSVHAELRRRTGLGLLYRLQRGELTELDRIFGFDKAEVVFFLNAGTAWLAGDGPG